MTNHLSIIIYHNITPSASYDAITAQRFVTLFFENLEAGTGGRTRTDMGSESRQILSLVRIPISPLRPERISGRHIS